MNKKKITSIISAIVVLLGGAYGIFYGQETNNTVNNTSSSDSAYTETLEDKSDISENEQISESTVEGEIDNSYEYVSESEFTYDPETSEISLEDAPTFRNQNLLVQHYEKHGIEMGFDSAEDYQQAAQLVVLNDDALHKIEAEDGDDVYYLVETNEFVIVSTDGYIRTYFCPSSGLAYYERQ